MSSWSRVMILFFLFIRLLFRDRWMGCWPRDETRDGIVGKVGQDGDSFHRCCCQIAFLGGGNLRCTIKGHKYNGKLENLQVLDSRNTWTNTRIFSGTPCLRKFKVSRAPLSADVDQKMYPQIRVSGKDDVARKKHLRSLSLVGNAFLSRYITERDFNDTSIESYA